MTSTTPATTPSPSLKIGDCVRLKEGINISGKKFNPEDQPKGGLDTIYVSGGAEHTVMATDNLLLQIKSYSKPIRYSGVGVDETQYRLQCTLPEVCARPWKKHSPVSPFKIAHLHLTPLVPPEKNRDGSDMPLEEGSYAIVKNNRQREFTVEGTLYTIPQGTRILIEGDPVTGSGEVIKGPERKAEGAWYYFRTMKQVDIHYGWNADRNGKVFRDDINGPV